MTALAAEADPAFAASDLELQAPGPTYTSTTLARLAGSGYSPLQIFFITGADAFAEIETGGTIRTARPRAFRGDLRDRPCCRGASIQLSSGLENDRRGNGSPIRAVDSARGRSPPDVLDRHSPAVRARRCLDGSCLRRSPHIHRYRLHSGRSLHGKPNGARDFLKDVSVAIAAAQDKKASRARRPGSATLVGVRLTISWCTGQNQRQVKAIADAGGGAQAGQAAAGARRRLRPRGVGAPRLLHVHRSHLHADHGSSTASNASGARVRIVVDEPEGEATGKASGPAAGRRAPRRVLTALARRPTASSPFFWLRDAPHAIDRSSALPAGRSAHPVGRRFSQSRRRSATSVVIRCQPGAKPASSRHAARVAGAGASRSIEGAPLGYDGALRQSCMHSVRRTADYRGVRCAPWRRRASSSSRQRMSSCPCRCIAGGNDRAGSTRRETSPFKSAPRSPTS